MVRGIEPQGGRRRRRGPQDEEDQPQRETRVSTGFGSKIFSVLAFGVKGMAFMVVIMVLLSIGSCAIGVFSRGRDVVRSSAAKYEQMIQGIKDERAEKQARHRLEWKEEQKRQAAAEEEQKKLEAVRLGVRSWLSLAYAPNEWRNLNLELRQFSDTTKLLTFPIIPYAGTHLPPLELALAPAGTVLTLEDKESHGGWGRNLWMVYQGNKEHTRMWGSTVFIANDAIDSPKLLLETKYPDQSKGMGSICTLTVQYPDQSTLQMDGNTRLALEKVFRETDLGKLIKVMDLPTTIDGVSVYWDLVVRCYPAWKSDPNTNTGRWMPSPVLDETYLSHFSPSLRIKQTENSNDPIWIDDEGLLSSGSFMISSEEMVARVHGWRLDNGYSDMDWSGGNQLYILVKEFPDRFTGELIGVTVRVVLRVRTGARG